MILFRKDLKALAEEHEFDGMDGNFLRFRFENGSLQADDIADIHLFEILVGFLTDEITGDIALDGSLQVLDMAEGSLTHDPFGHHPAGNADFLPFKFVIIILDFGTMVRYAVFRDDKWILSGLLQLGQLVPSDLEKLVYISGFLSCHGDSP